MFVLKKYMRHRKIIIPNDILLPEVARLLESGSSVTIKVKGESMLPFIVGDRDCVVLKQERNYTVGDIVFARIEKDIFVLHRLIKVCGEDITLMGDGNIKGVEKCKITDVLARVTEIITPSKIKKCNKSAARVWRVMLPLRRYLLAIYRRLRKI